ncbi:MAG: septation protein A [Proteobacteria bacterium]|nr:MAG: septation protein A [Pseudomonadota bacterium]
MQALIKLLIELGPLVIFFVVNGKAGILVATAAFMAATVAAMVASYLLRHTVPVMLWVSAIVVTIFGGATLYFENETFIKLKPTIIYTLFAIILFYGLWTKRPYLRLILGESFPALSDKGWTILTQRWAWFFTALAVLNEIIWRTVSTDTWVAAKLFVFLPLSFVFAIAQVPLIERSQNKTSGE